MPKDIKQTIAENLTRNASSKPGDVLECRTCAARFARGDWCFHQLCGNCFTAFDSQKMAGRFGIGKAVEDVDEWMKSKSAKC
jgi:hypothetical protein